MRYFCGISNLKLCFEIGKFVFCGYSDSDMAGDVDSRKSTSDYLIIFARGVVACQSRLQSVLHCLPLRLSSLLSPRLAKVSLDEEICVRLGFVIIKVLLILARILLFMVDLNILMCNIIRFVMFWTLNY